MKHANKQKQKKKNAQKMSVSSSQPVGLFSSPHKQPCIPQHSRTTIRFLKCGTKFASDPLLVGLLLLVLLVLLARARLPTFSIVEAAVTDLLWLFFGALGVAAATSVELAVAVAVAAGVAVAVAVTVTVAVAVACAFLLLPDVAFLVLLLLALLLDNFCSSFSMSDGACTSSASPGITSSSNIDPRTLLLSALPLVSMKNDILTSSSSPSASSERL